MVFEVYAIKMAAHDFKGTIAHMCCPSEVEPFSLSPDSEMVARIGQSKATDRMPSEGEYHC
ncbi:hypothetical protein CLAFUW4_01411 [Fulvia fulva]|uniref:Uncharacterized protein n=1 Tax=Passalora fulva TaxID=5499 RepID=A0A9Q8P3I3_PASFU|nr:uncharacterized protein CLAFUR5_01413 [Fulvia fulva]KAK4634085.1 hypothetical protein CLAFUR4_01412 [Fulvia fulva]KAK4637253.1 hypothetical protein CLAFUR0_01413 [Fulvia fulva]UJO11791.1 hypothetical protein CLAFUR5_01413 [Fulvia fulva]WPV08107.1 hypothetical protein CLAFUW4_01411 [Fulvia fulva]WPV25099.1 hypothetical protein CLAFUW7_01416 [Fulvia fulva]